ncbi:unnamed protein product [Parascedosporium putredinis]|uniref:Uncharacterized protein n=1 Tax=Parascedosporium putredinis TaxID=1442378 RepID=A0A9P1H2C9_9PEZI|nr:unnamed protein product [Parascedosporium putredinis]CAI7993486.1 unnamed protein product [Parascedosporium putredinis]
MSSATETVTRTRTARTVLTDYELHHSGASETPHPPPLPPKARPRRRRRTRPTGRPRPGGCPYRPTNVDRDQSEVRVYTHPAERAFIVTMFTGVLITATAAKQWRRTVGKIAPESFKYRIGGEF